MTNDMGEAWGRFGYSAGETRADVTWTQLTSDVKGYFTTPPLGGLQRRMTPRGEVLFAGDEPLAAATSEALLPLVEKTISGRSRQPRPPMQIVFPDLRDGEQQIEPVAGLRAAAWSVLGQLDAEMEAVSVLYGYAYPPEYRLPPEPFWGGGLSGLRLRDDEHLYDLHPGLGRFDLIRRDPTGRRIIERTDIRSWDRIPSATGDFLISRKKMNLGPFRSELCHLVEMLTDSTEEDATIRWEDRSGD